jgi:hypothetical protein
MKRGLAMSDTLHGAQNQYLSPGGFLVSNSGRYQLLYQPDGNLVIYDHGNQNKALWASNTAGRDPLKTVMQSDGNLVIYGFEGAQWSSRTAGKGNCNLVMQDDGNLVIYELNAPVWASNT